jgi:type VI secretion system protein VasD
MRIARAFVLLAAVFLACGDTDPPGVLILALIGGADQNPSPQGKPNSVAVRIYQLSSVGKFNSADVFALTEREEQTLGSDRLDSELIVLKPGEIQTITRELKPAARYLGVVVLFRDIDRAQWRSTVSVAATGNSRRSLMINALSARLAGAQANRYDVDQQGRLARGDVPACPALSAAGPLA